MRNLGELWADCHDGTIPKGEWDYQRRLVIDGVEYLDDDIVKLVHDKGLIGSTISFGNTISGKIKTTVIPPISHTVNKDSEIRFQLKVVTLNNGESGWHDFGYYYVDSAEREDDKWSITGYDLMSSLETPFVGNDDPSSNQALNVILNHMGITLDSNSESIKSATLKNATKYSMREVLGYIGSLSLGNWTITEENKLKLVKIKTGPESASINKGNSKRIIDGGGLKFTKVILKYSSSKKDRYVAGSGNREIEVYNPWGTQDLADDILNSISNYTFYTGDVKSTEMDPAVQLGDVIEIDGNVTNLWKVNYSTRMYADIQTPDQTDKFSQSYDFEFSGGDYDIEIGDLQFDVGDLQIGFGDLQSQLDLLIELSGAGDIISECVLLSEDNTNLDTNGRFTYFGDDNCVVIPRKIGGIDVNDLRGLFARSFQDNPLEINRVIMSTPNEISKTDGMFATVFSKSHPESLDMSQFRADNIVDMSYMFSDLRYKYIDLSNFKTHSSTNMNRMFSNAVSLESLDLSSFDTSNVTSMVNMFFDVRSLESLNINSFNTSNVTSMTGMFRRLNKLTSLNLSNFNTSNVTNMMYMFGEMNSLESLDVSSFDTSNVTDMFSMFAGARSLESLDVNSFDTSNVTDMSNMFSGMRSLISLNVSSFDTSNVTSMRAMFENTRSLESLDVSSFDTSNVTSMVNMFGNTRSLESLDLSSFDTSNVTSMEGMFALSSIKVVDLSTFDMSNVETVKDMFSLCFQLDTIYVRSNEDVDIISNSENFPTHHINFIVK